MTLHKTNISVEYVPEWGPCESIRELAQNGVDGRSGGAEMRIERGKDRFVVWTSSIPTLEEIILLGKSGKREDREESGLIGKFGEGALLGTLAGLRAGMKIVFRTPTETWTPKIVPFVNGGTDMVLAFDVRARAKSIDSSGFTTEMSGYGDIDIDFLFPALRRESAKPVARRVDSREARGHWWVGGLYGAPLGGDYRYGYDFLPWWLDGHINRDRAATDPYYLRDAIVRVWDCEWARSEEAAKARVVADLLAVLDGEDMAVGEIEAFSNVWPWSYHALAKAVWEAWCASHRGDSPPVPVADAAIAAKLKHSVARIVVTTKAIVAAWRATGGKYDDLIAASRCAFDPSSVDLGLSGIITTIGMALERVAPGTAMPPVSVVRFKDRGEFFGMTNLKEIWIDEEAPHPSKTLLHEVGHVVEETLGVPHDTACERLGGALAELLAEVLS